MAKTLKYYIHRTQACVVLPHSLNAVTRYGLIIPFSISARCVFVTQTTVCTTKTLASVRGNNYSKVVIKEENNSG